ncbi:type VI secretion system baseplate subunit TssF [Escherichia coli]
MKNSAGKYEIDKIEKNVSEELFRVNCSPVVNLFEKKSEPLRLSDGQDEYQVNADLYSRDEILIWDINKVILHRYENDLVRQIPLKNLFRNLTFFHSTIIKYILAQFILPHAF